MGDRHAVVEARERSAERARRVSLDDNPVRCHLIDQRAEPLGEHAGQVGQPLAVRHHVEIDVRSEAEDVEHLMDELPMLAGRDQDWLARSRALELVHDRGELDHLGTRPDDDERPHPVGASEPTRAVFDHPPRPLISLSQAQTLAIAQR